MSIIITNVTFNTCCNLLLLFYVLIMYVLLLVTNKKDQGETKDLSYRPVLRHRHPTRSRDLYQVQHVGGLSTLRLYNLSSLIANVTT